MTNLTIPIDDVALAQLQQLARHNGRDISIEAQLLLINSLKNSSITLIGDYLHSFFKDIPSTQYLEDELIIEARNQHTDRWVEL